jgi:hypothetical protein
MALLLTCRLAQGQTGPALLEQQFKRADSALSILLERPETRMKEIAPVEDLFRETLSGHPEFMAVLRTNSRGQIVNVASNDDPEFERNTDVSSKEWYSVPQESKRPYYSPIIQENQRSFLFWSRPILVRNSLGMSRFGGVIAAKIDLPVCFKLFAARFQGPFQILLKGKEFYYLSWDEHASYEEKPVRVPGVNGLTARFVSKKQTPVAVPVHGDSSAASNSIASKTAETKSAAPGPEARPMNPVDSIQNKTPSTALKSVAVHGALKKNRVLGLAGTGLIVAFFITGMSMLRSRKKKKILMEKTPPVMVQPQGLAKELDDAIRQSLHNEALEKIHIQETKEKVRADLMRELTASLREEIQEKYHEAVYEQELENLKKIVQEKLIEKEMPLMVESYRKKLSEEIRQKISDTFSGQIEKSEREKLTAQIAEQVKEEAVGVRNRLREEMNAKIRQELEEQEYDVLKNNQRDWLSEHIHSEIVEKDLPAIHDDILRRVSEEERRRVSDLERPGIIEAERNRIREQEAPGLREEVRAALREEELEAMHESVKTEIYAETFRVIKAGLEEEYKGVVTKKLEEYRDTVEKQVRAEIKGRIKSEYQKLIEHIEQLSQSMGNVEALDSLSQTITLLQDEKKKYKYFNLNTAQTESLLEYLKRVQNRFNIFLDKMDEAVREMVLKVNSVMNTLDNEE